MATKLEYATLDLAEGKIEAGPDQQERLEEFTERLLSGEFHVPVDSKVPFVCIDGRPGAEVLGPNAAGGTFTMTVADDLTTRRFSAGKSLAEAHEEVVTILKAEGYEVGGHCADHAPEGKCGCGAEDEVEAIYDFIVRHADDLRGMLGLVGLEARDEDHDLIVSNAARRTSFSTGPEISDSLRRVGGSDAEPTLFGAHFEVAASVNSKEGTTLDRKAVAAEFGPHYQAFNIDHWAFDEGARAIALSQEEAAQKVVAMTYYNLATSHVLPGKKMRAGVIR